MTTEQADKLKRIYLAHNKNLQFEATLLGGTVNACKIKHLNHRFQEEAEDILVILGKECGEILTKWSDLKPILRTLNDLTDEELAVIGEFQSNYKPSDKVSPYLTYAPTRDYLREIGVDADGLIESGFAISLTEAKERGLAE